MNIGFLGLGKLGLPVALSVEEKGHNIAGIDIDANTVNMINNRSLLDDNQELVIGHEMKAHDLLTESNIKIFEIKELVKFSDIIFVPIQTPHDPLYEGVSRLPDSRVDFDYTWLRQGLKELAEEARAAGDEDLAKQIEARDAQQQFAEKCSSINLIKFNEHQKITKN